MGYLNVCPDSGVLQRDTQLPKTRMVRSYCPVCRNLSLLPSFHLQTQQWSLRVQGRPPHPRHASIAPQGS